MAMPINENEMIGLFVPRKHYGTMVQTLARLMAEDGNAGDANQPQVPWPTEGETPKIDDIDWTNIDNCRRLRKHLKNESALAMLDMASERPGEGVYISDVMTKVGCTHGQASSGNGAITKAIRVVFNSASQWPAPFDWDKEKQVACYKMSESVAIAWRMAKAELEDR